MPKNVELVLKKDNIKSSAVSTLIDNGEQQRLQSERNKLSKKFKKIKPFKKIYSLSSYEKVAKNQFECILEKVLEDSCSSDDDGDCSNYITTTDLQNLCVEAAKFKVQRGMGNIEVEKLIRLITLLQTFIRKASFLTPLCDSNNNEHDDKLFLETVMEKITKAVNAALTSLYILTSPHLSSLVYSEDAIDQILVFTKYQICNTINPVLDADSNFKYKGYNSKRKQHSVGKEKHIVLLAQKVNEILLLLSELLDEHKLTDSLVLQVSSLGVSSFFAGCNILGLSSTRLLTKVFSKYEQHRKLLLDDILASVSSNKYNLCLYKLRSGVEIQMLTALFLQLVQSSTVLFGSSTSIKANASDKVLLNKYSVVTNISFTFFNEFLKKATASKCEDVSCRTTFDNFINDLLKIFNVPEWPVAELMLNIISSLLMNNLVNKKNETSLRLLSLDYLGLIATNLRTYIILSETNIEKVYQIIEKRENELKTQNIKLHPARQEMQKIKISLELLLNYLQVQCERDSTVLYARYFYLTIWYSDVCSKISSLETKNQELDHNGLQNDSKPIIEDLNKSEILEGLKDLKLFLKTEVNKDTLKVNIKEYVDTDDINEICTYLLSRRPLYQSFNIYLSFILKGLTEHSITIRAKAMKCLSSIVEIDSSILGHKEIHAAISHSFLDQSAQVREAAVDLVGKYILGRSDLILQYYEVLITRILDTAVSVRKRVIKILICVCFECPEFPKMPEVCIKIITRIVDEESIVSLVVDLFHKLWFTPVKEKPTFESDLLVKKIKNMTDVLMISNEASIECFEKLLFHIFKIKDKKTDILAAGKQIVICLIETIIEVEKKSGSEERLLSCTTMLYLISKTEPKLLVTHASSLQPYLAMKCNNKIDYQILNNVGRILEQILPLIDHPSELFLARLEENYVKLIMQHDQSIVKTCVSCLSSIVNKLTKNYKLIKDCFNLYYGFIKKAILLIKKKNGSTEIASDFKPSLNRSLFVIGLLLQYFDFENIEFADDPFPKNIKAEVAENLFYLLEINWDSHNYVLKAFGSMCIRYPDILLNEELKSFYIKHLLRIDSAASMQVQILNNIENFLIEEDRKWATNDKKWGIVSKKENLKELSDINLGMASSIVQHYLSYVLECMLHSNQAVRNAALKVIQVVLMQGVVFPLPIVPYLIAISTDEDSVVRNIAEKRLREIELKYPGYTHYKALSGVDLSFNFQKAKRDELIIRGFRLQDIESTPRALNSFLYTILKTKQQKRSLTISMIRQIEEKAKFNPSYTLYLADNLAYFPYRLQDEALFAIYQIDLTLSVAGTNFLEMFQGNLLPDDDKMDNDEEEEEKEDQLLGRFPDDVTPLKLCINSAQGCLLLGLLKKYLISVFGINNEKISEYSPSDNSKLYDKQTSRKAGVPYFNPSTFIDNLSNSGKENNRSLVSQYLQLKSLMNSLDPDDFLEKSQETFSKTHVAPGDCNNENIRECINDQQLLLTDQKVDKDLKKKKERKKIKKTLKQKHKHGKHRKHKRNNKNKKKDN